MSAYEAWHVEMEMPVVITDPFDRDSVSSWGAIRGQTWALSGGLASDYSTNLATGVAQILFTATGTKQTRAGADVIDGQGVWIVRPNVVATGGPIDHGGRLRSDPNYGYEFLIRFGLGGTTQLRVNAVVDGGAAVITSVNLPYTYDPSTYFVVVGDATGSRIRARAFPLTAADPLLWQLDFDDTQVPGAGQLGCVCRVQTGNTNVPFAVEWASAELFSPGRYVDITPYVDTRATPIGSTSGSTPETSGETGSGSLTINNAAQWFTPGNVNSPFYPNIGPLRRVRTYEVIGQQRIDSGAGYIEFPEIDSWAPSSDTAPRDQTITVSVVDRLARLGDSPTFISTVAAHVLSEPSDATLIAYYPLNDGPTLFRAAGDRTRVVPPITVDKLNNYITLPAAFPTITAQGGDAPPGDDIVSLNLRPDVEVLLGDQQFISWYQLTLDPTITTLAAGEILTVLLWIKPDADVVSANQLALTMSLGTTPTILSVKGNGSSATPSSVWEMGTILGPTADISAGGVNRGGWDLVGFQFGYTPYVFNLLSGGTVTSGTPVGSHSGSAINSLWVEAISGNVAHLQIYKGTFTAADYTAQRNVGLYGLEQQTTGERVHTILDYARVPRGERDIDQGTVRMARAALASQTPLAALAVAQETEQGLLIATGDNRIRFADRRRLYNI